MGQNQRKGLHVKLTTKGIKITQLGMANDVCPGVGKGVKMSGRWGERRN